MAIFSQIGDLHVTPLVHSLVLPLLTPPSIQGEGLTHCDIPPAAKELLLDATP